MQAAARGIIDFRDADPFDPRWWLRIKWLTDTLSDQMASEVRALRVPQYLSITANPAYTKETRDAAWKTVGDSISRITQMQFPWLKTEEKTKTTSSEDLTAMWARAFGDPKDPVVAAKIAATAEWLQQTSTAATPRRV